MEKVRLFLLTTFLAIFSYALIVIHNTIIPDTPRFQNSEVWLKYLYILKDYINAKPTTKQRLLIVSGSNSLFGFDSALIDSQTPFMPINYATHAGLPINYHIDKILKIAKQKDIIFLPLEFGYYERGIPNADFWYIQNMLTWDKDYREFIDARGIFLAYVKNSEISMLKNFIKSLIRPTPTPTNPIATMQEKWQNPQEFEGYTYTSLNRYGDFCTQVGALFRGNPSYLDSHLTLSPFFLAQYARLLEFAKTKHIKVFLTYPTTMENPDFSLDDPKTLAKIENLQTQLKARNIEIYGDFRDFHFERKYFFDTPYHLNSEGARLRTQAFIKLLEQMAQEGLLE